MIPSETRLTLHPCLITTDVLSTTFRAYAVVFLGFTNSFCNCLFSAFLSSLFASLLLLRSAFSLSSTTFFLVRSSFWSLIRSSFSFASLSLSILRSSLCCLCSSFSFSSLSFFACRSSKNASFQGQKGALAYKQYLVWS